MWQCRDCGRLYIDDRSRNLHRFEPADPTVPRDLLASSRGDRWQGFLRGHSRTRAGRDTPGELSWHCGSGGGFEQFTSRAELERRYYEEFRRLSGLDILRSAFLDLEGETTHSWPPPTESSPVSSE